jgi:hypothetical protein
MFQQKNSHCQLKKWQEQSHLIKKINLKMAQKIEII